jgi:hypothetical protein
MKQNNFVSTISFTLIVLTVLFLALSSLSWALAQNGMENESLLGNLNTSNASAKAGPGAALSRQATNIINDTHSYINSTTAIIKPGTSNHAIVLCNSSDPLLNGGYSIGFKSDHSPASVFIYANHPTGIMTRPIPDLTTGGATRFFVEGWEVGLLNNGNESITITAKVLCANVQ